MKKLHLYGIFRRLIFFLIDHVFTGTKPWPCTVKRTLLRCLGYRIGNGTTIVGPFRCNGQVEIGENCWINCGFSVEGNGTVVIGDNCDIAPDVSFLTGGHMIGNHDRRAGKGEGYTICVGNGCWIGARATILGNTTIGDGTVVAACTCVVNSIPEDVLVGGIPARVIRRLEDETHASE